MKKLIAALVIGLFASTAFTSSYAGEDYNRDEQKPAKKKGKKSKKEDEKKTEYTK